MINSPGGNIQRLTEILNQAELDDIVNAIETIVKRSGYGTIQIDLKNKRINRVSITETLKPGAAE